MYETNACLSSRNLPAWPAENNINRSSHSSISLMGTISCLIFSLSSTQGSTLISWTCESRRHCRGTCSCEQMILIVVYLHISPYAILHLTFLPWRCLAAGASLVWCLRSVALVSVVTDVVVCRWRWSSLAFAPLYLARLGC